MELGTYLLAGGFLIIFAPLAALIALILKEDQKVVSELESASDCESEAQSVRNEGLTNKQIMYVEALSTLGIKAKGAFTL
ncbi:hypothetical protein BM525_21355 (plasmid) [Alteromonas mediterranea]|uniref:Uncharacterized protein n=1 Tax=Alteromonas mediterranea TaxID=314275 RepID=A0AAC9JEP4_9ALTE|nr:hypothetical protein [Alteromonas mediterranea]APD92408.1 hypothetical protein BM524_21135 [Alteromonas mediterranea]APE00269.1 hypothetical protein BM525_21355 [Alteromonas mediterranea]